MQIVRINGVWYAYSWTTGYVRIKPPARAKKDSARDKPRATTPPQSPYLLRISAQVGIFKEIDLFFPFIPKLNRGLSYVRTKSHVVSKRYGDSS